MNRVLIFLSIVLGFATQLNSQNQQATIIIEKSENGETTVIEKNVELSDGQDINSILQELGVLDDLGNLKEGQSFEINVIKKDGLNIDQDIKIEYFDMPEFDFEVQSKAFLGVMLKEHEGEGVMVNDVIEGTQAEAAEISAGDVILQLDSKPYNSVDELVEAISAHEAGDVISLIIERSGELITKTVELGEKKISPFERSFGTEDFFFPPSMGDENVFEFHIDEDGNWNGTDEGPRPAFLGVSATRKCEADKHVEGVKIGNVSPNSSAEEMGIIEDDIIFKIDGETINNFDELSDLIKGKLEGDPIKVQLMRDGKKVKLSGKLGARENMNFYNGTDMFHGHEGFPDTDRQFFFKFDGNEEGIELEGLEQELEELMRSFEELGSDFDSEQFERELEEMLTPMIEDYEIITEEINVSITLEPISASDLDAVNENAQVRVSAENNLNPEFINFFPNPTTGEFNLKFSLVNQDSYRVLVYNQVGKTVFEDNRNVNGEYSETVDLSQLANGPYYLQIVQGDKTFGRKIIKE